MRPPLAPFQRRSRLLFLAVLVGAIAWVLVNGSFRLPFLQRCGIWTLTGLPCPLCGGTRSVKALLAGEWSRSFEWNPLVPPLVIFVVVWAAVLTLELLLNRCFLPDAWWPRWSRRVLAFSLALLMIWWGARIAHAFQNGDDPLVNSSHPVAASLQSLLGPTGKRP